MSAEFGPLDDDHETDAGVIEYCGGQLIRLTCLFFSRISDAHVRYQPEANRLSLHGESENAGSPFRAGMYAMWAISWPIVLALGMIGALAEFVSVTAGTAWVPAALMLFGAGGCVGLFAIMGAVERVGGLEVYDHTTPKPDERIEELADNYVDGELDREAFEQEVETIFEREAER